jgi:hypothetical protein
MPRAPYCLRHRHPPKVFPVTVEIDVVGVHWGCCQEDEPLLQVGKGWFALQPLAADNRANAVARGMSRELNTREVEAPNFGSARGIEALKTMQD